MSKVFVASAPADQYFVDLLMELFRHHFIDVGHSSNPSELEKQIAESDTLVVVISKHSQGSQPIAQVVHSFHNKTNAQIFPIRLDETKPEQVSGNLKGVPGIDFNENMLTGFQSLFTALGKAFLPGPRRRNEQDRRQHGSRRVADRRKSPILQRLRVGLWKLYERETGSGRFDAAYLTLGERLKAIDILQDELNKYECFIKSGQYYQPSKMDLDRLTNDVWQELGDREHVTAVIVMEALADKTLEHFTLKPIDRRAVDRRSGADRREIDPGIVGVVN